MNIGVNTFLSSKGSPTILPEGCKSRLSGKVIPAYAKASVGRRANEEEKQAQIQTVENLQKAYATESAAALKDLQHAAIRNENMFAVLMEATKYCSLGQLTEAMLNDEGAKSRRCCRCRGTRRMAARAGFEVGGQYRRNM